MRDTNPVKSTPPASRYQAPKPAEPVGTFDARTSEQHQERCITLTAEVRKLREKLSIAQTNGVDEAMIRREARRAYADTLVARFEAGKLAPTALEHAELVYDTYIKRFAPSEQGTDGHQAKEKAKEAQAPRRARKGRRAR